MHVSADLPDEKTEASGRRNAGTLSVCLGAGCDYAIECESDPEQEECQGDQLLLAQVVVDERAGDEGGEGGEDSRCRTDSACCGSNRAAHQPEQKDQISDHEPQPGRQRRNAALDCDLQES